MDRGAWRAAIHWVARVGQNLVTKLPKQKSTFSPQLLLQRLHHLHFCSFLLMVSPSVWYSSWQPTPVLLPGESQGQGAWWAAVYGVTQSQTRLKRLSSSSLLFLSVYLSVLMDFLLFGGVFLGRTIPLVGF